MRREGEGERREGRDGGSEEEKDGGEDTVYNFISDL